MTTDLNDEYRHVRFRCAHSEMPSSFFVITAYNPDGQTADDHSNRDADARLQAKISDMGYSLLRVTGGSVDFSHSEPGFGVSCSREQALDLAQKFSQDAIFEIRSGRVILISALSDPGPDEVVGSWAELCHIDK